ncbi:hypothetical protein LAZ67_13001372 [Cordylochernes scorpioides]|uniref:PiggyBac transposable element-derived protein domain-containing protein n=1 Tax=Cordylochernes scorpioides TaxID=51811 RepID=A0ABY6L794_9ARAC|nr:hypothetical protein LAZ67_13001372 [Cordylochernes scorpioides]
MPEYDISRTNPESSSGRAGNEAVQENEAVPAKEAVPATGAFPARDAALARKAVPAREAVPMNNAQRGGVLARGVVPRRRGPGERSGPSEKGGPSERSIAGKRNSAGEVSDFGVKSSTGMRSTSGVRSSTGMRSGTSRRADDGIGYEIFRSEMIVSNFSFYSDKLAPIRVIFEEFVTNCKTMYHPGEYLTVDENIIPFKGRCTFKQYLPNKPTKYGIKIYVLCCSGTSYVVNLEIYAGKQPERPYQISNSSNNVVERLVLPISGSKRNITTDNWYTSYPLAVALLNDHKLTLVGTLKKNKNKYHLNLCQIMHNKCLAQFLHSTAAIDEKTNENKKPEIITFYNMTKGGLDLLDQKMSLYSEEQQYHHIRSTTKSFSKPLQSIVWKHAGQSPETMEEDIPEPLSKAQKRCHLCSYKKERKDKTLCQNVCKEHSIIMLGNVCKYFENCVPNLPKLICA